MGEGVDRETLASLAETTQGRFRMAEDADALKAIYAEIDRLERTEIQAVRYMDYRELFRPLVLAALGLIGLEVLLRCTVFRRIP
jgi:Ca-activated chloride channel family protein